MSEGWQTLDTGEEATNPDREQSGQAAFSLPTGLRVAREATGLHIAALAAALKVPVKKLEALEAGRYSELPDLTFARALASSACRHLKIDAAPILAGIPHAITPTLGLASPETNAVFQADQSTWLSALKRPAFVLTGLVLLAALALAVAPDWSQWPGKEWLDNGTRWVQSLGQSDPKSEPVPMTEPTVVQAEPSPVETAPAETGVNLPVAGDTAANSISASNQAEPAGTSASASTSSDVILHLEAVKDSWVEVVDGEGKTQVQRVLKEGEVVDLSSAPPFAVVLGRVDAVNVQVRGQPFDVSPFARNSVARFPVK